MLCLCVSICLSFDLSVYLSNYPSIYLFLYLSIYLSVYLFIYVFLFLANLSSLFTCLIESYLIYPGASLVQFRLVYLVYLTNSVPSLSTLSLGSISPFFTLSPSPSLPPSLPPSLSPCLPVALSPSLASFSLPLSLFFSFFFRGWGSGPPRARRPSPHAMKSPVSLRHRR